MKREDDPNVVVRSLRLLVAFESEKFKLIWENQIDRHLASGECLGEGRPTPNMYGDIPLAFQLLSCTFLQVLR